MRRLSGVAAFAFLLMPTALPVGMEAPAYVAPKAVENPTTVHRGTIARNGTLETTLDDLISRESIHRLLESARPLYDLARLSIGHPFDLTLGPDGLVTAFSYGIDELRTLKVRRNGDALQAEMLTKTYDVRTEIVGGSITSSLFGAVEDAGEEDQLAFDLAQVFEWDVDFNTELQKGDSFRAAVEKMYLDDRFSRYGAIMAAELVRGDRVIRAVRFESASSPAAYYSPTGIPLRKTFLRSPLAFSRITSRFSRARMHPILGVARPHLGVDYAAPVGTPVRAAADGLVTSAGWSGGFGKTVRIRHGRGFETLYGHLARIAVRPGQRIGQGTLIGNVGSTGLSTGPHLDYRILKDGTFVNPLKVTPPPPEPISASLRPAFETLRDSRLALLEAGASQTAVAQGAPAAGTEATP
jgi:murein DD-endopeptidase MepM/ murein hydrolase activator NlpD